MSELLDDQGIRHLTEILEAEKTEAPGLSFGYDRVSRKLTIRGATSFPPIYDFASHIDILDMSQGRLTSLPKDFRRMNGVRFLLMSENPIDVFPNSLAQVETIEGVWMKSCGLKVIEEGSLPPTAKWITLTDNLIEQLPRSIGNLPDLEKFLFAGNSITSVPEEILQCQKLALIRASACLLNQSPLDLFSQLPNLAWYADAGNPFSLTSPDVPTSKPIRWDDLHIHEEIGRSGQNVVYRASTTDNNHEVAVKIYGGDVGSDGNAQDDMSACLEAGDHPHVIGPIGRAVNHPEGKQALVLPLIPPEFQKLAMPPSFETRARDRYPTDTRFSIEFAQKLLRGVSEALHHLHEKGIMHGDIYGHNILTNSAGRAYLGDFGSASFYDPKTDIQRRAIDIRAFGYLMDDLLSRCPETDTGEFERLSEIRAMCLRPSKDIKMTFLDVSLMISMI